jgi:hypothetical protein
MPRVAVKAAIADTHDIKPHPYPLMHDCTFPVRSTVHTDHIIHPTTNSSPNSEAKSKRSVKSESRDSSDTPSKRPTAGGNSGRPWTPEEKLKIFEIVVKHGASVKHFEGVIEGRTAKQCYLSWQ